jgi:C-terminal processing protease CtpA/Prc/tricorn protease-like protein
MNVKIRFLVYITAVLVSVSSVLPVNTAASGIDGDEFPLVRYPALSPDGALIAFCFQGDIWTVPFSGGEAKRLTIHGAYDALPKWNGDGSKIAFTGNRFGNDDIFVIPSTGGMPVRLTFHSTADRLHQWAADGNILFTTRRVFRHVERLREIHALSPQGGTPHRFLDALGDMPAMSPDKRYIAFVRGTCRLAREDYQGPADRDIWLYDSKKNTYTRLTDYQGNDFYPRWSGPGTIYYISSQSGRYNIHSMTLTPGGTISQTRQVTRFKDMGVRYFDIAANGKLAVMERGTSIYTVNLGTRDEKPGSVPIKIGADYRFDPVEHKSFASSADEYAVSPNGKLTAFVIRGEIFVTENNKEKKRTVNLTDHPFRDQDVTWLSDDALIFSSDRYGQYDLFLVKPAGSETTIFKALKHQIIRLTETEALEHRPLISPDRKKIAYTRNKGELVVADISPGGKLSAEKILLNGWAEPRGVSWSPDSRWLAYAMSDLDFNDEIYIHAADNSRGPVNVSMHPRDDYRPVWSPDGSKLGFLSIRNNNDIDVWFVWLRKKDWEKTKQDWEESDDEPAKKSEEKEKKKTVKPVVIDFQDIHERLVQVTRLAGDEGQLTIAGDGETFYYTASAPGVKGTDLYRVKWDGTKTKAVTTGGQSPYGVKLGPGEKYLYLLKSGGTLARIDTKGNKMESLPFTAKMKIIHPQERRQIFNEACRTLKHGFYDPDFHGRDWDKLVATYKPMVLKASTDRDFRDMFNLMLGQLNASHMGMYGPDRASLQKEKTGLLGIEVEPLEQGVHVTHVIPDSPAFRQTSRLNVGDVILSVDGSAIDKTVNFYSLFTNKANERVLLEVKDKSGNREEVVIRPQNSLSDELYAEWVKGRRRLTDKYSQGRLGYLHIESMGWTSFERFEREITAVGYDKEGIVIDVRFNGGGWTTDYLMAVLNVKQHAYTIPRGAAENLEKEHKRFRKHYAFGERLPFASWTKPAIALCNANSYSNAEIFSHAFKNLGIGKLVGEPTFGAVISTGGRRLIDGSFVRMPFRGWFVKATDQNMENGPAVPDIIVYPEPDDKARGMDRQLQRAVEELLKEIGQKK